MAKTKDTAELSELANFLAGGVIVESTLSTATKELRKRRILASGDEAADIDAQLPALEAEIIKIQQERLAFLAGDISIDPPSNADVTLIRAISTDLSTLLRGASASSSLLAIATAAVASWNT